MAYGTIKVDNITFDNGGVDKLITVSGLFYSTSGALTVTGTISGGNVTAPTATFTTLTGTTTAGTTATFTSGSFTSLTGVTTTVTSGIFGLGSAAAPSITLSGDLNTGIYSPGADQLAIVTNGTQRLLADSAGGVTVPTRFIIGQVNNVGGLSETTRTTSGIFNTSRLLDGGTNPYLQTGAEAGIVYFNSDGSSVPATVFRVGGAEKVRIDSSGNLGLGVVPSAWAGYKPLQVGSGASFGGYAGDVLSFMGSNAYNDNTNWRYILGGNAAARYQQTAGSHQWYNAPSGTAGNTITFTQAMTLDANGRLGIGTTDMYGTLNVQRNTSAQYSTLSLGDFTTATNSVGIYGRVSSSGIFGISTAGAPIVFYNTGSGTGEAARIESSGRLLVGTFTARVIEPYGLGADGQTAHTYESVGDSTPGPGIALGSSSTTDRFGPYLYLFRSRGGSVGSNTSVSSGDNLGTISFAGADGTDVRTRGAAIYCEVDGTPGANDMPGRLIFSTTADGAVSPTERMRISADGSISIATNSQPSTTNFGTFFGRTNLPGLIESFRNTNAAGTAAQFGGNLGYAQVMGDGDLENTNARYTGISDIKFKQNIEDASSQWDDIKAIQVRKYELIANPDRKHIGVIAQELEQTSPGLVIDREDLNGESYKSVAYSVLYMKAVKALQEAIARIETLETRLSTLEGA